MTITHDRKFFARMHANTKEGRALLRAFRAGAAAAADHADQYNDSTVHEFCLGDCILFKMNIRKTKPRKNVRRLISHKELIDIMAKAHRKALTTFIPRR
jgi:hypothetical protein